LIIEQLRELNYSISAVTAGQEELKTVSNALKTDITAVSSSQEKMDNNISAMSAELKTDITAVEDKMCAMQEDPMNDLQDKISAIKEGLRTLVSDLSTGQTELEERVADKLDKELKGL
jgi:chromosome segregation ATPase